MRDSTIYLKKLMICSMNSMFRWPFWSLPRMHKLPDLYKFTTGRLPFKSSIQEILKNVMLCVLTFTSVA